MAKAWLVLASLLVVPVSAPVWGQARRAQPRTALRAARPARTALPSDRAITSFAVAPGATSFDWSFTAAKDGRHTAGANWEGGLPRELTVSVTEAGARPITATGPAPVLVPFAASAGKTYVVAVSLPAVQANEVAGELAVVYGVGDNVSKRALNTATPMSAEAFARRADTAGKDALLPLVAALAERRLANVQDKNELDLAFDKALAQHPGVSEAYLQRFVKQFNALPEGRRSRRFVAFRAGQPPLAPITRDQLIAGLREAGIVVSATPAVIRQPGGQLVQPGGTAQIARAGAVLTVVPKIDHLEPQQGLLGWAKGRKATIVGYGFSPEPVGNTVELKPKNPELTGPKTYAVTPKVIDATRLEFAIPIDLPSGKWMVRVVTGKAASNEVEIFTSNIVEPGAVPGPVITSITPVGQRPSQQILVNGKNFLPGVPHQVFFTNLDLADAPTYWANAKVLSPTQLQAQIPEQAIAGNHAVKVSWLGSAQSDAVTYGIGAPRYRVVFEKMICVDESDPEWMGDDELVTFWSSTADGNVWTKNSEEYTDFSDGTEKGYSGSDSKVVATNGDWTEVKWALAVSTRLYEWDAGDVKATQDFVGFMGDIGAIAASIAWGPEAGPVAKLIAEGLSKAIGELASWFGGDPDFAGQVNEVFTATELQNLLKPGESTSRTLNFINSDTGDYKLVYRIYRE
jgi:hypothetical protein